MIIETKAKHALWFTLIFSAAALVAMQINFSAVLGGAENQYFTVFQFFGPIAGGFLGPIAGAASVLIAQVASAILVSKQLVLVDYLRFAPMLFAAFYFGAKAKQDWIRVAVPLAAMVLFWANPVGGQAWEYALFWLIPVACVFFFKDSLFAKSIGSTFTAHSIGSVIWLYSFSSTPAFWFALIPVVVYERLLFASGITVSFAAMNSLLLKVENKLPKGVVNTFAKYSVF